MGDISNMNDIDRFMRSTQGQAHLDEIVAMLKGRTITDLSFSNEIHCIATTLSLDNDTEFVVFQPSLEVDALRDEFADAIEEEYYKDYPERRKDGKP